MTKRKSLIDWWGGETHPKTTTLCYYSCRELLDEGFFCFHHDCFKDDQPAMKCSPVPHVTRILFQGSLAPVCCMFPIPGQPVLHVIYRLLLMPGFPNQGLHHQRAHSLRECRETKPGLQIPAHNLLLTAFPGALAPQSFGSVENSRVCRKVCVKDCSHSLVQFSLFTLLIIAKGEPWRLESRLSA